MSIPRDTMVPIPSCTRKDGTVLRRAVDRRCSTRRSPRPAPACTIKTVEKLTKIRIDHYVVVDFGGFKDMVNALRRRQGLPAARRQRPAVAPRPVSRARTP